MYLVRLPSGELINLALVRRIEVETTPAEFVLIHWSGNDKSSHRDRDADAILKACSAIFLDLMSEC